ncbi:antibiotic biosynthesis monooxygenase family protein [Variovorax sp.]|uniref:antibiotic biosynthesis monooxygenase family protein n=1 Tax=Variovorax sp. TaxID=1871043 RepID=UPI002D598F14|nr:antibiotic biosynthesis monooxygenase family protein [Variovorax sp.]HYP82711.1 antibiotic biosynthesis monooxygenase family protein [Variovorax sp.]
MLEVVLVELSEPGEAAFETALGAAAELLRAAPGYCGHQAGRCLEEPGRALLMIWWNTLEDHTVRFRGSPAYPQWRRLIDPHIRPQPSVRHFQL